MNAGRHVAYACAIAITVGTLQAQRSAPVSPQTLLSGVPARVENAVWLLEGGLARAAGVDRWRLLVNDAQVFESAAGSGRAATPLRLGIILRPGDNLVSLEAVASVKDAKAVVIKERWSTHVHRADPQATQFALLAAGDHSARTVRNVEAIRNALLSGGVPPDHIKTVNDSVSFATELSEMGPRTRSRDQVLLYYSGPGRVAPSINEPELLFEGKEASVPVGNVVREASDLPGTSILLDIAYSATPTPSGDRVKFQNRATTSAQWLRGISDAPLEVAYTNPSSPKVASDGFTGDFVNEWQSGGGVECRTFARLAQSVATANSQKASAWPLFFTQGESSFRFCPAAAPAHAALAIHPVPSIERARPFMFVDVSLPSRSTASELNVDGVPVPVPSSTDSQAGLIRIPIGPGLHIVEARPLDAGDTPPLTASTGCAAIGSSEPACVTERQSSGRWSPDLVARIDDSYLPGSTSEPAVAMSFVVGGGSSDVRYQIRNNGVVIRQEAVKLSAQVPRRQIVQRIPLMIGTNNLALDVISGEEFASSRAMVDRRRSQGVRAVIVGVDSPAGAPALAGASTDAMKIRDLLLEYSDASPQDLQMLTGAAATREAVLRAIAGSTKLEPDVPQPQSKESAFVLYFAGYGLSIKGQTGVTRCLLTVDFDPSRPEQTCLSTEDISLALDKVGRSIVIVDTSYDGPAGPGSRTYSSYLASDTNWRLTSGTDRPNRLFLVAGGSNTAAYEARHGGLFTEALAQAVRSRLGGEHESELEELSLQDAWDRARDTTSSSSDRKQVPVMKGVLSEPFRFIRKTTGTLKHEADSIERAARNDLTTMRGLDERRLERAEELYEKLLAVNSGDFGPHLGIARVRTLQGNLASAAESLDRARPLLTVPSPRHADWLSVSADIKMRNGDIPGALIDARAAIASDPLNQSAAARLGLLYGTVGDYDRSFTTLAPLLSSREAQTSRLTEEERGQLLLHAYLALRQTKQGTNAALLLKSYFADLTGSAWLKIFKNPVVDKLLKRQSQIVELGQVGVQTPWSHLVAQFFLDPEKYKTQLASFVKDTEPFDPRDPRAFDCLSHFYVGMLHQLDQKTTEAEREFEAAVATGKTAYVEYWMARAQLKRTAP